MAAGKECEGDTFLPLFPNENEWNDVARALLYFFALCYFFLGISIVADKFMESIGVITS